MRSLFREGAAGKPHLPFIHRREVPANLWLQCPNEKCKDQLYVREYEKNLKVCQKCQHHGRLSAAERVALLLDPETFREEDGSLSAVDALEFESLGQRYAEKLVETRTKTGLAEALVCGRGELEGHHLRMTICDFAFLGASMGSVVGEKFVRATERCVKERLPLVAVVSSGGARMHEGIYSLMQMAKTSAALARMGEAGLPFFSVLTDPTTGGVTASWAGLGDVLIAEPGALIGFAGPRVIEQITKQKLPPDAQRAEFLLEHGMVDMVVERRDLRPTLAKLLRLYSPGGGTAAGRKARGEPRVFRGRGRSSEPD